MPSVQYIESEISDLRNALKTHPLYQNLNCIENIKHFMEIHVFAVWDFMSILKSLQTHLTCTKTPWVPTNNATLARFINEIVHAEESDIDEAGIPKSHFEMYLDAMLQVGANTTEINKLINLITSGKDVAVALSAIPLPAKVSEFIKFTFSTIQTQKPHIIAAAFTFGREDVIPDMFLEVLKKADSGNTKYNKLRYYLERHIALDGDTHGPLSLKMVATLCGTNKDKWQDALNTAQQALSKRIALWDAIYALTISREEFLLSTNL